MRYKAEEGGRTLHLLASIYREHESIAQRHNLLSVLLVVQKWQWVCIPWGGFLRWSSKSVTYTNPQGSPNLDFHHDTDVSL